MHEKYKFFYPNDLFININFESVKEKLKDTFPYSQDFGSIFITRSEAYEISINDIGRIGIHYTNLSNQELKELLNQIEAKFQDNIQSFQINTSDLSVESNKNIN
ncbi:hypothetical protein ACPA3B_24280 [Bacillus bombysepticus]